MDTNAYLREQQLWAHSNLHQKFLLQQMFQHTVMMGWKNMIAPSTGTKGSHHQRVTSHQSLMPWNSSVLTSNVRTLMTCTWRSTSYIGCPGKADVKRQQRSSFAREVMELIKGCLRLKWPPTQPKEEWLQPFADITWLSLHAAFADANHRNYKEFVATSHWSYEEVLALARDTNQWALVVAAMLEEWMERMSCSTSCHCSSSCQHRRSRSSEC